MAERPNTEDVLVYRGTRKTRLSVEEEFLYDVRSMISFDVAKRRRLEGFSKSGEDLLLFQDAEMASINGAPN
jgi:hypothetical protein